MREENRKMFAGHGQNNQNNVSNQALFGWLASRPAEHVDGLINGGGPQSQPSYFTSQQQNQLPQHLTTQFSLMRETYPKNQQQQQPPATRGLVQHVDGLANHPNSTQTLLNLLNALGPSSSLSASLGGLQGSVVFAGNQASAGMQQQFRDLARGSISAPLPCNQNESHINSSLRLSTVIDFIPQKEERTVSEGSSIVPCRARGMPKEHNAKTAYFVLPKDIKHGDGLRCSHVQCQNKGIRFVYCKFCDVPVAKINFSTRHKHADATSLSKNGTDNSNSGRGSKRSALDALGTKGVRDAEKMCRSLPPNIEIMSEKGSPTQELHVPRASKGHNNEHLEASSSEGSDSVLSEKQKSSRLRGEWLSLLEERPPTRDREKMKLWLKRVETISEPDQSSLLSSSAAASTSNGSDNDDENFYLSRLVEEGSVTVTDETNRGSQTSSNAEVKKRGEEAISTDFLQGSLSDSQD